MDFGEFAGGGLGVDVELAEGFEFRIEEFEAEGAGGLEREEIEDAASDSEMAAGGDGGVALVAVGFENFGKVLRVELLAGFEVGAIGEEGFRGGSVLVELVGAEEDGEGIGGGEGFEDGEPFGGGFGILDFQGLGFRCELKLAVRFRGRPKIAPTSGRTSAVMPQSSSSVARRSRWRGDSWMIQWRFFPRSEAAVQERAARKE